jgi:hypothetical protein
MTGREIGNAPDLCCCRNTTLSPYLTMTPTSDEKPPCLAVFHGNGGYPKERKRALETLTVGAKYVIVSGTISQSYTSLTLQGIPGTWNSTMFDFDWESAPLQSGYLGMAVHPEPPEYVPSPKVETEAQDMLIRTQIELLQLKEQQQRSRRRVRELEEELEKEANRRLFYHRVLTQAVLTHSGELTVDPARALEAMNETRVLEFGQGGVRLVDMHTYGAAPAEESILREQIREGFNRAYWEETNPEDKAFLARVDAILNIGEEEDDAAAAIAAKNEKEAAPPVV